VEDNAYLSPEIVNTILSKTNINYIKSHKVIFNNIQEVIEWSEKESDYRTGIREGIVIKHADGRFCNQMYKVVNKYFQRREDFNKELIKNTVK
jgi:hypothetical protein